MNRRLSLGIVTTLVAITAGCGSVGLPDAVTSEADSTARLWGTFLTIALVVGVLVYVLIAIVLIKNLRSRRGAAEPSQRQYVYSLEIVYTVVPLVVVVALLFMSERVRRDIDRLPADPDVIVEVQGFQWQWQFRYPDSGIVVTGVPESVPVLVVPTERTVRFTLESRDVIHSFWVPEFLDKRDLIPGFTNEIEMTIEEPGEWSAVCSEFCGLDHWKMRFIVRALPPDEFDGWVASTREATT